MKSEPDLKQVIYDLNEQHNAHKIIPLYRKVPNDITLEDVKAINKLKQQHNDTVDLRDTFTIGDLVRIQLMHGTLEKARK